VTPVQAYNLAKKIYGPRNEFLRLGQWAFICLHDEFPEIADKISGDDKTDPFYVDARIPAFEAYIFGRINET
jgi:hypothetical protein